MTKYHQGRYKPQNPQKYKGDPTNIIYRSSWELKAMRLFDLNQSVLEWSSEEIVIPYISPKDNRPHRYFCDFFIKMRNRNNQIENVLIEIKPLSQTKPPIKGKRLTKGFINEVLTYGVNQAKFQAAEAFCDKKGWRFQIMTEKELGI